MTMSQKELKQAIPAWIWHPEKAEKRKFTLSKTLQLGQQVEDTQFHIALTGEVKVELNGEEIGQLKEDPQYIVEFTKIEGFPSQLPAGKHELTLHITCTQPMPVAAISAHLTERSVGCLAYIEGQDFWLPTNETWQADDGHAAIVCLYGEEPYGDLDNSPEWFVAGGFGDIEVEQLSDVSIINRHHIEAIQHEGVLRLQGKHNTWMALTKPQQNVRDIFYHLRKQRNWQQLRALQKEMDLTQTPQVRIDLNKEYNARFRVTNNGATPLTILWNGAESLYEMENYDGCITEWFEVSPKSTFVIQPQGMRFLHVYVMGQPKEEPFNASLQFEAACVALEQVGTMHSNLPLLNDIFDVSVHTNRICHQLGLWDGIKRDRLNWAYDFYMAGKADYVLWKDFAVLKRSVRELGKTPYGYWMNNIPSYTLWWITNLWEYFFYTGDREFILEMKEDLHRHIRWIEANMDLESGFFKERSQQFIEWVPMEEEESWLAIHAVLAITKESLDLLDKYIPELDLSVSWPKPAIAEELFLNGAALVTPLLGINAGYVSKEKAIRFLHDYKLQDPLTPLSAFWLAECYSEFNMHEQAWQVISTVWGKMLEEDATTFWESIVLEPKSDFHDSQTTYTAYDSYRMSLCHSWTSTPVQWVSRYILGVEPVEPGYKKITFTPQAISGLTECQGTIGTPNGKIQVEWNLDEAGKPEAKIQLPEGIEKV